MWQITWITYGQGKASVGCVTTPNESAARTVYTALRAFGWIARLWTPTKELAA